MQRHRYSCMVALVPLIALAACGGGGSGSVASTPAPPVAPAPSPPPPPPASTFDTGEYRRSNAAVQAQAIAAYQAGATGRGVTAAVIDSGLDLNGAEFTGRISPLSADLAGTRGLQDVGGHGTAVASVLLGAKNNLETHGVAFDATLLVARTDTPGSCTDTTVSDSGCTHDDNAIARGVDLAVTANARVINISLGGSPANGNLRAAIGRATATGIIVVISAGNDFDVDPVLGANPDPLAQIALDPIARGLVLIAGATDKTKTIARFSNRAGVGAQYYLTALGVEVRAPDQTGTIYLYDGTSFSAPVVAGAVALLAQAFPNLTGAQIVDLLLRTTTDLGAPGTDAIYGKGELNLAQAFAPQGQTSLGASAVPVSLISNGTLSTAMGDAGQAGMSVTVRDSYARDYKVDLAGTLARAPRSATLAPALTNTTRHMSAAGATTTLALSIAERVAERLLLSRDDYDDARALAGSIATRIDKNTQVALGFATASDGLDRSLANKSAPAFLVADGRRGLEKAPRGAFALRRDIGPVAMTIAGETGDLRIWERDDLGRGDRYRRYGYGAVTFGADGGMGPVQFGGRLTRMTERETVLGARFVSAFGGGGASSWFTEASATLTPANKLRIRGEVKRGWTTLPAGDARLASTLTTQSMSFEVSRASLLAGGDSLSLRLAEPLRVTSGGIDLVGFDTLSLTPVGRERDLEGVYSRLVGPGWLTLNGYWRQESNNFATAPDDVGLAMRYAFSF